MAFEVIKLLVLSILVILVIYLTNKLSRKAIEKQKIEEFTLHSINFIVRFLGTIFFFIVLSEIFQLDNGDPLFFTFYILTLIAIILILVFTAYPTKKK